MNPTEKTETLADYETTATSLTVRYSLYICTKDKENKDVIQSKIDIMRDKIKLFMCNKFGGCYEHPKGQGTFYNEDNKKFIQEGTYIISVNCSFSDSLKYEHDLIQLQKENCIYLNQHSATIEKNNRMYFITAPPEIEPDEKEIFYGNQYKDDFKTLQELKNYVNKHIRYSSLPMHTYSNIEKVEGREIKVGDIIFVYPKYSSYTYDCFKRVVKITKCYICYCSLFAQGKLAYHNMQDFGQSKQMYFYEYNYYNDNNISKCKKKQLIYKLPDYYQHGFLYLTYFRH
jgi:hypothetical protein